jgi:hypothetical protein
LVAAVLQVSATRVSLGAASDCKRHIELHGGKWWASELGKSETWVVANHRINLWQNPSPTKGRKVGEMRVGSRAVIIEEGADDYKVRSPLDGTVGWVGRVQVARALWQDAKTFKPCVAPK